MNKVTKLALKRMLSRVNATLRYYEADWISVRRSPELGKTRVTSFEEYVEIRANYEAFRIPELREAIIKTEGHLFICEGLTNVNTLRHKFKSAKLRLIDLSQLDEEFILDSESLAEELEKVREFIGGNIIIFNSVESRIKITISEE